MESQLAEPGAGVSSFALKVLIVDGEKAEHFWLTGVTRSGSRITGTIDNDPVYVKTVQLGERYEFTEAEITDWMFIRNGKIVGNETIRPLLKRMPKERAAQFRAMLEEP